MTPARSASRGAGRAARAAGVVAAVSAGALTALVAACSGKNHQLAASAAAIAPLPATAWNNHFPRFEGNVPLPEHPALRPDSAAMMDLLVRVSPTITGPAADDAQANFYDAKASDPTHTMHCTERWGPAPSHQCVLEGQAIHIPADAAAAANTDRHLSIVEPDGCTVDDFWQAQDLAGPVVTAAFASRTNRCRGTGFNLEGGAGAAAGNGSLRLGRSPLAELRTGVIHHALEAAPACNNGGPPPMVGQATNGSSQPCGLPGPGIPMGAYVWSDVRPDALPDGLDPATRMICVALHRYGAVVNDTNGKYNGISINGLWNSSDPNYAAWAQANMTDGKTDPAACFPGRDWSHHLHVLDWTVPRR